MGFDFGDRMGVWNNFDAHRLLHWSGLQSGEICKDMDFHAMIRSDAVATKPELLAVPAWDFKEDDWSHARVAILRSVENGVPMARTARNGLLLLNDRYGRIVVQARSVGRFTTLVGDLPLNGHGGTTIYDRSDDAFGWLCSDIEKSEQKLLHEVGVHE